MVRSRIVAFRANRRGPEADASAAIVRLYGSMVYGTGLRITGDAHYAADVTQETFFHLLQNAGRITGSLGGWLHQVATRRAIDLVRRDSSRNERRGRKAGYPDEGWGMIEPKPPALLRLKPTSAT